METDQFLEQKRHFQKNFLEYIDHETNVEENYQNFINLIFEHKLIQNRPDFESFLNMILKVSNNHHRSSDFFSKIEKILLFMKNDIQTQFSNSEIFSIFKGNKHILLFLFNEKILDPNKSFLDEMFKDKFMNADYLSYFFPEIKTFLSDKELKMINIITDGFEEKRIIGENESHLCEMIRNDLIDEFISYVHQTNLLLTTQIKSSIFETNSFLIKNKNCSLIEYAAFFGSMQIFKYLHLNGIELKSNICIFAVHGDNPEMIHYLEENKVFKNKSLIKEIIDESIKCHHNEIANYIQTNYLGKESNQRSKTIIESFKYYNYSFFPDDLNNEFSFYYLCKYNHISLVKLLLSKGKINVNCRVILNQSLINRVLKNIYLSLCHFKIIIFFLIQIMISKNIQYKF